MKQYISTILAVLVILAALPFLTSCENEQIELENVGYPEFEISVNSKTTNSVFVYVSNSSSSAYQLKYRDVRVVYSTDPTFADSDYRICDVDDYVQLNNLREGTTYYLKLEWTSYYGDIYLEVDGKSYYFENDEIGEPRCTGDLSFTTRKNVGNPTVKITDIAPMADYVFVGVANGNEEYELSDLVIEVSTSDKFTSILTEEMGEFKGIYSCYVWDLEPSTKYYYRIKGKAYDTFNKEYSSVTKFAEGTFTTRSQANAVDLGLSVKWADRNLGAPNPWNSGKSFYFGSSMEGGYLSSSTTLPANIAGTKYDAATIEYGAPWQLPSVKQWEELFDNCVVEETKERGVSVFKFTSVLNGNSIVIPIGPNGIRYWTSDLDILINETMYVLLSSDDISFNSVRLNWDKYEGRAVCK